MAEIVIAPRFNGPDGIGNGGYVSGRMAAFIDGPATCQVRAPWRLGCPISVKPSSGASEAGVVEFFDGAHLVGIARPGAPAVTVPPIPTEAEIHEAGKIFMAGKEQLLSTHCFVCSPYRASGAGGALGDGLSILTGPVPDRRQLAAAYWTPSEEWAGPDGVVRPEILWAALDCSGYFASGQFDRAAVLGQLTGQIHRAPKPGERLIAMGWVVRDEGRKLSRGSALIDAQGEIVGLAEALWIDLKPKNEIYREATS